MEPFDASNSADSRISSYRSFRDQALHYFTRDHQGVPEQPLVVPAAWRGDELGPREQEWVFTFSDADVREIEGALERARSREVSMEELDREGFVLPTLASRLSAWAAELKTGRGFVLLRGLPVERWGEADSSYVFWALGLHLGLPGAQNPAGDLLGHVADTGEEASDPHVRRYRTAGDIAFHCDLADVVGLMCLRTPHSGGASRIASSVTVFNELIPRRPDLAQRLFEPMLLDLRGEEGGTGMAYLPVAPATYADGHLRTFYHSDYFRSVDRHPDVPTISGLELELLDTFEEIANSPGVFLDMQFQPGDVQLLSNHFVVHSRTRYQDHEDPAKKRHLLRLWLSL